jgi:MYXO-CTERM domain-containing protein
MRTARIVAAAAVGISYPSLVATIAAGILTFTAARVFAESGPLFLCSDPRVTECLAESVQCSSCGGAACKCEPTRCVDGGERLVLAFRCGPVSNRCEEARFEDCKGKSDGAACGAGSARCVPGYCEDLLDGSFAPRGALACETPPTATDAATEVDASNDAEAGGAPASPNRSDDSGCSTTPGSTAAPLAGGSVTLGLMLLWRLRRRWRQPTKAPSSRNRS